MACIHTSVFKVSQGRSYSVIMIPGAKHANNRTVFFLREQCLALHGKKLPSVLFSSGQKLVDEKERNSVALLPTLEIYINPNQ